MDLLVNRYLHGDVYKDPKYESLIKELLIEVYAKASTKNLSELLRYKIGDFNDLAAELYIYLAEKYLRKDL